MTFSGVPKEERRDITSRQAGQPVVYRAWLDHSIRVQPPTPARSQVAPDRTHPTFADGRPPTKR